MLRFIFCEKDEFMKILKRKILSYFAGVLIFSGCISGEAEGMARVYASSEKRFDVSQSLSKWPILNPLESLKEKEIYDLAWNQNKSLKENRENLFNLFLKTCCDFSFNAEETEVPGVFIGEGESGTPIVFVGSDVETLSDLYLNDIWLQNSKKKGKKLKVNLTTTVLHDMRPLNFMEEQKDQLKQYIKKLTEDSVGCELLRVAVAKYGAKKDKLEKIKFLPVQSKHVDFAYVIGANMWQYIGLSQHIDLSMYRKHWKKREFILFSPDWFNTEHKGPLMRLHKDKTSKIKKFVVDWEIIPKEVNLLHEIIHAIHPDIEKNYRKTTNILGRSNYDCFFVRSKTQDWIKIEVASLNVSMFRDDEILRTMHGVTSKGIDPISESAFLSHRDDCIRPAFIGDQTRLICGGQEWNQKQLQKFSQVFFESPNADRDLYRYHLLKKSTKKYPEFGQGNYLYTDDKEPL